MFRTEMFEGREEERGRSSLSCRNTEKHTQRSGRFLPPTQASYINRCSTVASAALHIHWNWRTYRPSAAEQHIRYGHRKTRLSERRVLTKKRKHLTIPCTAWNLSVWLIMLKVNGFFRGFLFFFLNWKLSFVRSPWWQKTLGWWTPCWPSRRVYVKCPIQFKASLESLLCKKQKTKKNGKLSETQL